MMPQMHIVLLMMTTNAYDFTHDATNRYCFTHDDTSAYGFTIYAYCFTHDDTSAYVLLMMTLVHMFYS
jgi:hypothetical protein